jgi:hypothetical protein
MKAYFTFNDPSSTAEFMQELHSLRKANSKAKHEHNDETMDRYLIAKSAKVGAHIHCPNCGTGFTKQKKNQVFCKVSCGHNFHCHYSSKNGFRSRIDKGKCAGKLLGMTRKQLIEHLEAIKAQPLRSIFFCAYCGNMGVKKRTDQCYCLNKHSHCRDRFRLLIRERESRAKNPSEPLALLPDSAILSVVTENTTEV